MSIYLKNFGCPDKFTNDWKKLHVTKWILLWVGMALAVSGYYVGCSLMILDGGHQMWILCSLFWGSAGVCIVAYSIALLHLRKKLCKNIHQTSKTERELNAVDGSNFQFEECEICAQRDKQISERLSTPCYKLKSFSGGLNKDVYFKGKYIGFYDAGNGMDGSFKTVHEAETVNISNGVQGKFSDELSDSLSYSNKSDISYQLINSFNDVADETFESQKVSSALEESLSTKCTKWQNSTSQLRNEIGFKDIRSNLHLEFRNKPEKGKKENIVHMFDKDIEINNSFQLSPSFKCEFFEDPYFCKTLREDKTMELAVKLLVSWEQTERSKMNIFPSEFASFATIFLINDLRSDILEQSYDKFLKTEDIGTATDDVKDSDKQLWSKIPMKRSNSKLTKKRCEPIVLKNPKSVSKNQPDIPHWEKSSTALISANSRNESTVLFSDSKTCRPSEIALSSLTFSDELPTILI